MTLFTMIEQPAQTKKANYTFHDNNKRVTPPIVIDREEFTRRPIPVYGYCESFPPEAKMRHVWVKLKRTGGTVEYCENCKMRRTVLGGTLHDKITDIKAT